MHKLLHILMYRIKSLNINYYILRYRIKSLKYRVRLLMYRVKRRPSVSCIAGFMIMLVIYALFLVIGQEVVAEILANLAYLLLVMGVSIRLYHMIRYGNEN
jgi:hypothetical protein